MCGRTLVFTVFVLGLFADGAQSGQLSVEQILRKVAETYQNLHSYQFVAQSETVLFESHKYDVGGTAEDQSTPMSVYAGGSAESVTSHIEFAAVDPGKVRLSVKEEDRRAQVGFANEFLVVSDGQTTWAYMPLQKAYTEESAPLSDSSEASHPAIAAELNVVRQYWSLLVGRFRGVSKFGSVAKLDQESRLKIAGEKIDCYVVKWQTEEATDEMWIDKDRFIVWRLKQTPRARPPAGTSRNAAVMLNVMHAENNVRLGDNLFTFTLSDKATKVTSLKWPRGNGN